MEENALTHLNAAAEFLIAAGYEDPIWTLRRKRDGRYECWFDLMPDHHLIGMGVGEDPLEAAKVSTSLLAKWL